MSTTNTSSLPDSELTARIALACAGLSGNRHIGKAVQSARGAHTLVAGIHDGNDAGLPEEVLQRVREFATPASVVVALEATQRREMRILTPTDRDWPAQVAVLRNAAPLLLWCSGRVENLHDLPVAITGAARPSEVGRRATVDVTLGLADKQWTIAATCRPGIDELAMNTMALTRGRAIAVASVAVKVTDKSRALVVSENPPAVPVILGSALRSHALLAAIADKVLITEAQSGSGALRTGIAAHALGRPLGVLDETAPGSEQLRVRYGASVVRNADDVERLR
jgi:predicted Rossmann fold nucleotide-binding protein DprA/Smf involved in DNA uptake